MDVVSYIMVYVGSALMAFNIYLYVRFERKVRTYANWSRESKTISEGYYYRSHEN